MKQTVNAFARGGFQGEARDWDKELEEERKEIDEEKEKKKVEDLWAGRSIFNPKYMGGGGGVKNLQLLPKYLRLNFFALFYVNI